MLESTSKNDCFLGFKPIFDKHGNFSDYIFINASNTFENITGLNKEEILGKRMTDIVHEYGESILEIKEIYYSMIPNTRKKFEKFIPSKNRWYYISIFSDSSEFLYVILTDITDLKQKISRKSSKSIGQIDEYECNVDSLFRDSLTGIYNRSFFDEELKRLDTERNLPLSIIMADANGLKLINDAFGHFFGDEVIKNAAYTMKSVLRSDEIVSRIGGDEFAIILPNTDEEKARRIIGRLKKACYANPIDFLKLSISFGAATKTNMADDITKVIKTSDDRMYLNKLKESKEYKSEIIEYLRGKLEEISYETKEHSERLKLLAGKLSHKIGLSSKLTEELYMLCELHDIGKVGIPKEILMKSETLDTEEWEKIRKHSEIGYRILSATNGVFEIEDLILDHHEYWDGKGYPNGLKGEAIPIAARIFAIIDAYDSMINERPYRGKMSKEFSLGEIELKAGKQFDPTIARIFIELMKEEEDENEKTHRNAIDPVGIIDDLIS